MGGHTYRMVVPTIPNQSFEFWIFCVIPVFYQELLHFLPHIPERDTRPVIVQAGFPDPVGHFIYSFLLWQELSVGWEGGRNIRMVIAVVRTCIQDDEITVFENPVMLVIMAKSMIGSGHQNDIESQILGFFLLADIFKQGGQFFL